MKVVASAPGNYAPSAPRAAAPARPVSFYVSRRGGSQMIPYRQGGVEAIRQWVSMIFLMGSIPPWLLCLVDDALGLGATHVRVDHVNRWRIVSADVDWLRLPEHRVVAMDRLFVGMHVYPSRINGMRSEVFVGAFAEVAYVATPDEITGVVGDRPLPDSVKRALCPPQCARSVAFLLRDG